MGLLNKKNSVKFFPLIMPLAVVCTGEAINGSNLSGSIPPQLGEKNRCVEREREALLTIKQSLIDDEAVLSSWGSEDGKKECCSWYGVECNNTSGHVTGLYFQDLRGEISSALLELHHLNEITFQYFGGNKIPEFMGSIKSLRHLELDNTNFVGIIPPQLGNLTNLRTLILTNNHVWSDNLDWLSRLSFLTRLDLSYSKIRDAKWLQHVLRLPSLQELHLSGCMLTDVTPSANLFVNSSSTSLYILDLSDNELTSSFDWLFNISTSLVKIDVSSNELDGPIPDEFGKIIHLEDLDLSSNMLEGGIPKSFGNLNHLQSLYLSGNRIEESLGELFGNLSCKLMRNLYLSNNQLTGSLPDLRKCVQLEEFDLSRNKITGFVPVNIGQLSNLYGLDLSHNSLQGTISDAHFVKLRNLHFLGLSFNSLTLHFSPNWTFPSQLVTITLASCKIGPSFPTWLQSLRSLEWIDLSSNGISDKMPEWFWNLSQSGLFYMNISHNQISGTIPDFSSNYIDIIDISSNKFSGPLPLLHPNTSVVQFSQNNFSGSNISSSICLVPFIYLVLIDLSSNQLSGSLPNCWENMPSLVVLNMNNNIISSEIPHSLGSLQKLRTLHLGSNNLSGDLPSSLKNCRALQLIDIGENKLSGNITQWLGEEYVNLAYLSLRGNQFYGGIPREICKLTRIQMLDLSRNNIAGKIPQCFNNFTSLVDKNNTIAPTIRIQNGYSKDYIDYALVQWKGVATEYKNTLGLLKLIDLSSNKLVGSIPKSFSKLRGLISLNLSRNSLTGNIDPNIGQMEMLECLDLSRNQLSGRIPIGLAQMHFLNDLDLANNNLSGKIPLSTQLQSFNESVFGGNSNLCGKPLVELCQEDRRPPTSGAGKNIEEGSDGFFNLSSMQEFCLSMVFGFIVGFWGVVGSLILKKSWRGVFFYLFDAGRDWLYVTTTIFVNKFRRH